MEFSRQEYWSGEPFPFPGDLPNPEIEPRSPALQADSLLFELGMCGLQHMTSLNSNASRNSPFWETVSPSIPCASPYDSLSANPPLCLKSSVLEIFLLPQSNIPSQWLHLCEAAKGQLLHLLSLRTRSQNIFKSNRADHICGKILSFFFHLEKSALTQSWCIFTFLPTFVN